MKYHVARDGEKLGEFSDLQVSAGLRTGEFKGTDLCWAAGMKEWEPLSVPFPPPEPTTDVKSPEEAGNTRWSAVDQGGELELASLWQRFIAWWVDGLMLLTVFFILTSRAGIEEFVLKNQHLPFMEMSRSWQAHLEQVMQSRPMDFQLPSNLFLAITFINVIMLITRGQTIGKFIMGIRVVKNQTGAAAGFVSVIVLRSVVMLLLFSVPFINLGIWLVSTLIIFRRDRRCLHDLIADTMVIKKR